MVYQDLDSKAISESIQMYLLKIVLLQEQGNPVPLPTLAKELAVTPVSANEMCKKLTEKALLNYEPYKGVTLTAKGNSLAQRILRRRLLWEVFFVEKLDISPKEAEEMACRFEHVTPTTLIGRLEKFLGNPTFSPYNVPIPRGETASSLSPAFALTQLVAGKQGQVVGINSDTVVKGFLRDQGIQLGVTVKILAVGSDGSLLIEVLDRQISLSEKVAQSIKIMPVPEIETA